MTDTTNNNEFSCAINFNSEDYPSRAVNITYSFSHDVTDRILEGKDVPAAYAAMQDIATMIKLMQSKEPSFNWTDEELENMTPEQQEIAVREAAALAIHTVKVPRLPS